MTNAGGSVLEGRGIPKTDWILRIVSGILLIEYAGAQQTPSQCPLAGGCGTPIDYGLYNTVGWVLVVIGLIQIAASFYIARTHSPTERAVANPPI